jgi:predicted metal-dependent peptidase
MNLERKIREWFDEAVDELYLTHFYLAAEITKLGYPDLVPENSYPPTAGVLWDDKRNKVRFVFNESFFKKLNKEEFKYVITHESTHVMNLHILLFKEEADRLKAKKKSNTDIHTHIRKLNIAADCVVNDSITTIYKMPRLNILGKIPQIIATDGVTLAEIAASVKIDPKHFLTVNPDIPDLETKLTKGQEINIPVCPLYGMNVVGLETWDMSAMDVFYLLPEDLSQCGVGNHDGWESFFDENGQLKDGFAGKMKRLIENNIENSALSDEDAARIEEIKEGLENSGDAKARMAGKEAGGNLRPVDGLSKNALNWNKILFELTESKKPKDMWNRPPRKLMSVYPDVILPMLEDQEKEEIFFAIDCSGSIDRAALSLFVDVVKNTPKHFQIKAITFDTQCYEYDIKKGNQPRGGGGTAFDIIEQYIQDNFKKYPKAVFVLTDGEGSPVNPQHPNKWCWLLYGYCSKHYIGKMKSFNIKEVLK